MPELKLATPLKYNHPKGTPVTVVDQYIDEATGEKIWFKAPKVEGVYILKALKFFQNSEKIREKVFKSKGHVNPADHEQGKAFIDGDAVFEFFTESCSGIILLFASVESLVNRLIEISPKKDYKANKKIKLFSIGKFEIRQNKSMIMDVKQILLLPIEEKLKGVLPYLYGIENPANKNFWQSFKSLKLLRDGFIHCTREHAYGANKGVNSLYSQLFDLDYNKMVNDVGDLLISLENNCKNK